MAVDSKPEALDELDRRIMQLKIEREALKKETDEAEKERLSGSQKLKEELDKARTELELAQRKGDLARAGELAYGVIPDLEKKLKQLEESEAKGGAMAQEVVTPDLIAQ